MPRAPGTFVRPMDAPGVYRAPRLPPVPTDPAAWLDARLLAFEPALVRALRAAGPDLAPTAEVLLEREDVDRWHDALGPLPTRAVHALLERLRSLFADDVVASRPGAELETPALELSLELGEGRELGLRFAPIEDGVLATRTGEGAGGGWVLRIAPEAYALVRDALRALAERPR